MTPESMKAAKGPDEGRVSPWVLRWRRALEALSIHGDQAALLERLEQALHKDARPAVLAFANAHAFNLLSQDPCFADNLAGADLLLRDGIGVQWLCELLGREPGLNLNGTDLIPQMLAHCPGQRIALFGSSIEVVRAAGHRIATEVAAHSEVVAMEHGFHSKDRYRELAKECRPTIVILGMGMLKQEDVALDLRGHLSGPCLIVCGGAILDFLAGRVSRAPIWMRRYGVEWAYRLALEPRRLFKRYVLGNPLFLIRAVRYCLSQRRRG